MASVDFKDVVGKIEISTLINMPADQLRELSDRTSIGVDTLKRMGKGEITPSKNQTRKVTEGLRALSL